MNQIKKLKRSQRYEVLDLWLRCTMLDNPFIEENFWQKHYDEVRDNYLINSDTYVYLIDGVVAGFMCITDENYIRGLFVDPKFRSNGIGAELVRYAKEIYSMLDVKIYMKSRSMVSFATHMGFVIDGASMHAETGEIQYNMIWDEND